jgi:hypothetical protein
MSPLENYPDRASWIPGLRISGIYCLLDVIVAILFFFGIRRMIRLPIVRGAGSGYVLGLMIGVIASLASTSTWRSWPFWIVCPMVLLGLPAAACYVTRHSRSVLQLFVALTVSLPVASWTEYQMAFFRSDHGFSFAATAFTTWNPKFRNVVLYPLVLSMVLFLVALAIRRITARQVANESMAQPPSGGD